VKLRNLEYTWQANAKITTYFYRIYINQWKKQFEQKNKLPMVSLQQDIYAQQEMGGEEVSENQTISLQSRSENLLEKEDLPYQSKEREWVFVQLEKAFNELKEDCQMMLSLFYVEELSLRVIAERLHITEASATLKRFRCAKYLRELFISKNQS
jgi:RNA polymerase sigma factor (sigma-70 family)